MTRACSLAQDISKRYFAQRCEETPELRASRLLRRNLPLIDRQTGCWPGEAAIFAAYDILDAAAFSIDDLAENFLGVTLTIEPLTRLDHEAGAQVFGLAYPSLNEITICERAENYLPLFRTTVAHELGHIVLHNTTQSRVLQYNYSPASIRRPRHEAEADEFMEALLLPNSVLFLAIAVIAQESGLLLSEVIHCANTTRGRWQWKRELFRPLVERLCLSREMLVVQLRKLGVFEDDTVAFHRQYRLPNKWLTSRSQARPLRNTVGQVWQCICPQEQADH